MQIASGLNVTADEKQHTKPNPHRGELLKLVDIINLQFNSQQQQNRNVFYLKA